MAYTQPKPIPFLPERNSSTAGIVVSRLRLWLSPVHVDVIVFLFKNYLDIDSYGVDDGEC